MIRRNEPRKEYHVCGTPDAMCDTECMENAYRPPNEVRTKHIPGCRCGQDGLIYDPVCQGMDLRLRFDRDSFDALKTLLRETSMPPIDGRMEGSTRRFREGIKRVFDQIRDTNFGDTPRVSLDHE